MSVWRGGDSRERGSRRSYRRSVGFGYLKEGAGKLVDLLTVGIGAGIAIAVAWVANRFGVSFSATTAAAIGAASAGVFNVGLKVPVTAAIEHLQGWAGGVAAAKAAIEQTREMVGQAAAVAQAAIVSLTTAKDLVWAAAGASQRLEIGQVGNHYLGAIGDIEQSLRFLQRGSDHAADYHRHL
ncbi:MAG: hypothetical protein ACRDT6_23685 [Micromonosporaceae bacterium]